ncbi:MAG: Crp/Fnr family transcriptional regulator [Marinifilaceae bacterium]
MENIVETIMKTRLISDEVLEVLKLRLRPVSVPKRGFLIDPSRKDENIYFIEQGIARAFTIINGKEVTSWFSAEGGMVYSTKSVHGDVEGYETETVQVLEDSLLYVITIGDLESLCDEYIEIANWMRKAYQKAFVEMEKRLIFRYHLSAEERYRDFINNHSDLLLRVNLGYVASYLGMSQVTLCALRKLS